MVKKKLAFGLLTFAGLSCFSSQPANAAQQHHVLNQLHYHAVNSIYKIPNNCAILQNRVLSQYSKQTAAKPVPPKIESNDQKTQTVIEKTADTQPLSTKDPQIYEAAASASEPLVLSQEQAVQQEMTQQEAARQQPPQQQWQQQTVPQEQVTQPIENQHQVTQQQANQQQMAEQQITQQSAPRVHHTNTPQRAGGHHSNRHH